MSFHNLATAAVAAWAITLVAAPSHALEAQKLDITSYPTLQAAIDGNPGAVIHVPPGDYVIDSALRITHPNTIVYGPARIIQSNPDEQMAVIQDTTGVRLENLSFTRAEGKMDAKAAGIEIRGCKDVEVSNIRISENHTHSSILVASCSDVTVQSSTIINYKGITVDDRTENKELYGYAFKAVDGTGVQVADTDGVIIRNNRIQEFKLWPTKENRDKFELGTLTIVPEKRGRLMDEDIFDTRYTNNWHQGAAIQVTGPEVSRKILITGNYIDHPAQGLDLHCDYATVTSNFISHAMIGMKAMHGAKHILIDGNQFSHVDLWGLLLMPGSGSYNAADAGTTAPEDLQNVDGGTIVSNNLFSDFGFGDQYWNWTGRTTPYPELNVITVLFGQLEENPPIRDILITGNLVYDSGRDGIKNNGKWEKPGARYNYGLYVEQERQPAPVNVRAFGNLLNPGMKGDTNLKQEVQ